MDDPFHEKALTLRRTYFYPFWRIENTARRWEFGVAKKTFNSGEIDTDSARQWADNWRKWLFKGAATGPEKNSIVYLPLQGRLLESRSFQTMSPLAMVQATLEHETERKILLGLHPKEAHSDRELAPFRALAKENTRVTLQTGGMVEALRTCDYIVTQNSAAALSGFFFHKPAVLFAKIDFHHIGVNVADLGVDGAFAAVHKTAPPFDQYLYWFVLLNSIKADAEDAEEQILAAVRRHGWVV